MSLTETCIERPLQVVTCCRARDLPVLEITARKLLEFVPIKSFHVIAPDRDCRRIGAALGSTAIVISEDTFIPGMTRSQVRAFPGPLFPHAAGWYFQQLLKLQFAFEFPEEDYYLIWDADTVPLRPLRFFDGESRMLLTKATEFHAPYFDTYQRMFREAPHREFSFIAQHMIVQKSIVREMLSRIHWWKSTESTWPWKVLSSLAEPGGNLFSEYETYGHYVKNHYPDRIRFVERNWLREGAEYTKGWVPSSTQVVQLAQEYDFAAFERVDKDWPSFCKSRLKRILWRVQTGPLSPPRG